MLAARQIPGHKTGKSDPTARHMSSSSQPPYFLSVLRCPYCSESFEFNEKTRPSVGRAEFGILQCSCSEFAVVDGIPIIQRDPVCILEHTSGRAQTDGISVDELVRLIKSGDPLQALLECLAISFVPKMVQAVFGWRLSHGSVAKRIRCATGKRSFLKHILERRDQIGACDVLGFYYFSGGPLSPTLGHYFIRRFSQPRHLAALALAATMPSDSKPILDIACGIGHLEHYFYCRNDSTPVIGLDMNFYHLWLARHWIAPEGNYVCANAGDGLPFADASFSSTICSDAYHYIPNAERLLNEIDRCAPDRAVV